MLVRGTVGRLGLLVSPGTAVRCPLHPALTFKLGQVNIFIMPLIQYKKADTGLGWKEKKKGNWQV